MITRVKLKNWKSHLESDLQFGEGTNVLVGIMGSGKSSLLEAVTYALFGTLPAVQTRRIKLENLITSRPRPMDSAEVEVGFISPDGGEYSVKRVIQRGSGTTLSELRKVNGDLIESPSSTRVSEAIRSLLKLDYDLFERAIYSEQNRLDYFLTLPRGKRMESIDELLGIDKLELARKEMGTLSRRVNNRVDDREDTVGTLGQDAALIALPGLEQELKDLELSRQETQAKLQQLQPELGAVQAQLTKLKELEQKLTQLESSSRELDGRIGGLERQINQVKGRLGAAVGVGAEELKRQVETLEKTYGEARAGTDEINSKLTASSSHIRELETKIGVFRNRREKLSREIERKRKSSEELEQLKPQELTKLVEKLEADVRSMGDELAACRARMQDLQQASVELKAAGSTCPVCESPLPEDKKEGLLKQREGQLEEQRKRGTELEKQLVKLNEEFRQEVELQRRSMLLAKEIEDLSALDAEHSQLEQQLQSLGGELVSARAEMEKLRSDFDRARQEADKLREQLLAAKQTLQLRSDFDQLKLEHKQKLAERLKMQRDLWQLKRTYDESQVKELERRLEALIRTHERLKTELVGREQVLVEKRKLVDSIREKREMLERYGVEIKYLKQATEALESIKAALARTQTTLRREFIEAVNGAIGELWEDIYPYGDFTGIRLEVEGGERGADYVLQLRDRMGNWVPVEGIASGGERTDACLALRIAFAIVLAPALSWLVLDEPTHNLDAEGIRELAVVLRERIPEVVRQVLLITHEERLEAAVSGYLYRFSRDKDADQPTKIEQAAAPELMV
jgi:exonuclease SbcC